MLVLLEFIYNDPDEFSVLESTIKLSKKQLFNDSKHNFTIIKELLLTQRNCLNGKSGAILHKPVWPRYM